MLKFGASMFFTDYSMAPAALAKALEERGFESVWAAEHSHIPLSRKTPFSGGGDLPKQYYDAMDPFVVLWRRRPPRLSRWELAFAWWRSAIRSRPRSWWRRSTLSPAAASCSASAMAGTRTRWRTTARPSRNATRWRARRSRR